MGNPGLGKEVAEEDLSSRQESYRPSPAELCFMERLFKHKRAAIQDALGKADSDQDGLLLQEEFAHALEELGIYPGKYDFETLWTQHAESESTPRQLDWKKLVTTFVRFATERYVQQSSGAPIEAAGPSSGLESTRCRSSAGKL